MEVGTMRQREKSNVGSTSFKVPEGKSWGVHAEASVQTIVIAAMRHIIECQKGKRWSDARQAEEALSRSF
jgi:hypothetical protein